MEAFSPNFHKVCVSTKDYSTWLDKNLDELEIQQYTGLKDRNGIEIYEGDILEELIMNETETQIGVCKQVLGGWRIFAHPNSSIRWHGWKQRVIGNIHENRDLLK